MHAWGQRHAFRFPALAALAPRPLPSVLIGDRRRGGRPLGWRCGKLLRGGPWGLDRLRKQQAGHARNQLHRGLSSGTVASSGNTLASSRYLGPLIPREPAARCDSHHMCARPTLDSTRRRRPLSSRPCWLVPKRKGRRRYFKTREVESAEAGGGGCSS